MNGGLILLGNIRKKDDIQYTISILSVSQRNLYRPPKARSKYTFRMMA